MGSRFVDVDELIEIVSKTLPKKQENRQFSFAPQKSEPRPDHMQFKTPSIPQAPLFTFSVFEEEDDEDEEELAEASYAAFAPFQPPEPASVPYNSQPTVVDEKMETHSSYVTAAPEETVELDSTYFGERYDPATATKIDFSTRSSIDEDILYGRAKKVKVTF